MPNPTAGARQGGQDGKLTYPSGRTRLIEVRFPQLSCLKAEGAAFPHRARYGAPVPLTGGNQA